MAIFTPRNDMPTDSNVAAFSPHGGTKMPAPWRVFFILFVGLLAASVVLTLLTYALFANSPIGGFAILTVYMTLLPATGAIALTTIIGLAIYTGRYKRPHQGRAGLVWLALKTLLVGVGLLFVVFAGYLVYVLGAGW